MARLTVGFNVATAALQNLRHLRVERVEAQPALAPALRRAAAVHLQLQLGRMGELQRLQQAGLTVHQIGDGVDREATLGSERSRQKYGFYCVPFWCQSFGCLVAN